LPRPPWGVQKIYPAPWGKNVRANGGIGGGTWGTKNLLKNWETRGDPNPPHQKEKEDAKSKKEKKRNNGLNEKSNRAEKDPSKCPQSKRCKTRRLVLGESKKKKKLGRKNGKKNNGKKVVRGANKFQKR